MHGTNTDKNKIVCLNENTVFQQMPDTTPRSLTTRIFNTQSAITVSLSTAADILINLFQPTCQRGGGVCVELTGTGSVVGAAEF
jgi:hypothetical protein